MAHNPMVPHTPTDGEVVEVHCIGGELFFYQAGTEDEVEIAPELLGAVFKFDCAPKYIGEDGTEVVARSDAAVLELVGDVMTLVFYDEEAVPVEALCPGEKLTVRCYRST